MPVNSARKWVTVEINAKRRCQDLEATICFTDSVKLMRHELLERERVKYFST